MSRTLATTLAALAAFLLYTGQSPAAGPVPVPAVTARFLFDSRFSPPLLDVSSFNKDSFALAVQAAADGFTPARVVSIDHRGREAVIEELSDIKFIELPEGRSAPVPEGSAGLPEGFPPPAEEAPVTSVRAYLSGDGRSYAAVYLTAGPYYELRYRDSRGGELFTMRPRDGYGLSSVVLSRDGGRVLVSDESPPAGGAGGPAGQRFYIFDRKGEPLADGDMGEDLDNWLDISGGAMASDGSWYMAARGRGTRRLSSLVLYGGDGRLLWEKSFYETHQILQGYGGLVRVKGGNQAFISLVDKEGALKVLERKGYGFEFWLSDSQECAYVIKFKDFDFARSGVREAVKELFPKARLVLVDLNARLPKDEKNPSIEIAPDGGLYIFKSVAMLGSQPRTTLSLVDSRTDKEIWRDSFFAGDVVPRFNSDGKGFFIRFGYPAARLIYYGLR